VLWIRFYACNEQIAFQKRRRFSFSSIVAYLTCRRLANCTGCLKFFAIIRKFCRRLLLPKTHHNRFLANDKPDCIVLHHYDRGQLEKHGYSSNDTTNLTGHSIVADNGGKYQPMPGRVVFELARIDACGCLRNPRTMGSRITPISPTLIQVPSPIWYRVELERAKGHRLVPPFGLVVPYISFAVWP